MKNLFPRNHILLYLQAVWTFPDAFALVHVRSARKTMSGRVRFVTTAGAEWMATIQLAVLASTDFVGPAQVFRAANISASVALCWFVVADYVNIVAHSVGDLTPIDCRRVTQFCVQINTIYYFKNTYSITNLCIKWCTGFFFGGGGNLVYTRRILTSTIFFFFTVYLLSQFTMIRLAIRLGYIRCPY